MEGRGGGRFRGAQVEAAAEGCAGCMRILPLLAGLMLTVTLASLAPTAAAMVKTCSSLTDAACPGLYCSDGNGDGRFDAWSECKGVVDPCHYQSDCCAYSGLWCPEYEDS